jgi:hypothetical protein
MQSKRLTIPTVILKERKKERKRKKEKKKERFKTAVVFSPVSRVRILIPVCPRLSVGKS